eukprot:CAMPEP_0202904904 /NCGR_PEP_ID=MMETSP1392-20130828/31716_1 /ASSEMBLY_ACC=CAM_ASM_000868 /TAXON_ID=225041 /ORGANISM="Chlamydomonas chlamydogama, Strain SAG 11-48b" /LENGTH=588 /DNA_ID=CAMNT_0049592773 /DNA_START=178 /DNA_END=1944 /DNA_ORIENTATION=-
MEGAQVMPSGSSVINRPAALQSWGSVGRNQASSSPRQDRAIAPVEVNESPVAKSGASSPQGPSDEPSRKKKGVSRTVSQFFSKLFNRAEDNGVEKIDAGGPLSKSFSASKPTKEDSFNKPNKGVRTAISNVSAAAPSSPPSPEQKPVAPAANNVGAKQAPPQAPVGILQNPSRNIAPNKENSVLLSASKVLPLNMARPVWCLKDYAIVEKMYTGYASTVYKAWCKHSGETVCLKAYNMSSLCELNRFQIYREVKLHSSMQHENIISLYGAFQQGDQVVLVQEYADSGDLFLLLHRYGGKLPERTAVELVLYPFLLVLNYLHQNCIVHRDIKPENVLFTRTMALKLCDFGLAIDLREERAVTRAGTLEYMAPEVLNCPFKNKPEENKEKENLHYNLTVDTWAVGVLTYELLVGFPPFNDKQRSAIEEKIRVEAPRFPSSMSELARNFIQRTLQKDALERPTIIELLAHPWIKAHRRNSSMRNLGNLTARSGSVPRGPVPGSVREDEEAEAAAHQPTALKLPALAPSDDMRTHAGDLLKPAVSHLSFTQTRTQSKVKPGQLQDDKKLVSSAMSFSSAQNPKLQALRAGFS